MDSYKYLIGIDIGGTKISVSLGRLDGDNIDILDKKVFLTEVNKGPERSIKHICECIDDLIDRHKDVLAIGISCGGPLDSKEGIIMSPPNLPGWDNIPIKGIIEKRYGIPTSIQNDANACCLAEWKYGAGKGTKNCLFFTFGTGMGAGLILDGRLYVGTNDMAGEVGHIRVSEYGPVGYGKIGSFEGYCSGGGIAQLGRYKALERIQQGKTVSFCKSINDLDKITAKSISEAAFNGDSDAREVYEVCARVLGRKLSALIDLLNPEIIILGSIYWRSRDLLEKPMMEEIVKDTLPHSFKVCKIVPAAFGDELGDLAALSVATYSL